MNDFVSTPEKQPDSHASGAETLSPIGYEKVKTFAATQLHKSAPFYNQLLQARHELFELKSSQIDSSLPTDSQIYPEGSYNNAFTVPDMRLRVFGQAFHEENESYNPSPDDTEDESARKAHFRNSILRAAQELGYVSKRSGVSINPRDLEMGVQESTLAPIAEQVEAIIIPAAAGKANYIRPYDAIRNIESGAIRTNKIIVATGERSIPAAEKNRLSAAGLPVGDTEFESMQAALKYLLGVDFTDETDLVPAQYGIETPHTKVKRTSAIIGGNAVEIIVCEAAYDRQRRHENNSLVVNRANTEETMYALFHLFEPDEATVVIESHDTWVPYQEIVAQSTLGLYLNKSIVATGPFNDARITKGEDGATDIAQAEGVIDEIIKNHEFLVNLQVAAENANSPEIALMGKLTKPIPDLEAKRQGKAKYRTIPIEPTPEFEAEKLVPLASYGVSGQAYYSRDNATTGVAVPGIPKEIYVRESIAETLAVINKKLDNPIITAFFGGEVELYVEDGYRSPKLQNRLFHEDIPDLLRSANPTWSETEILARRNEIIAEPQTLGSSPSPHQTGAALDVVLRYKQGTILFVSNQNVPMGHVDGKTDTSINPDFFESNPIPEDSDSRIRNFRRAFYNIMSGSAFGIHTGFQVNPTEFWHWSRHDQLASYVAGHGKALYNAPKDDPITT